MAGVSNSVAVVERTINSTQDLRCREIPPKVRLAVKKASSKKLQMLEHKFYWENRKRLKMGLDNNQPFRLLPLFSSNLRNINSEKANALNEATISNKHH